MELACILERHGSKAKEKYPEVRVARTLDEMLSDKTIALCVVATPNDSHFSYTKACLEAGRDVVVDKPFAPTLAEAEQLVRLAADRGRLVTVYQDRRWDGDFQTVKRLLKSGAVGAVAEYEARFDRFRPQPRAMCGASRSQGGDARELVVPKESLIAFSDPRWSAHPCSEKELADALRGPPLLFEVEDLDKIRWHGYFHAYGFASELPKDIRHLASSDPEVRDQALWELFGSKYHQETIYPATAVIPFLLRLASDRRTPDAVKIWELLDAIAESSTLDPDKIRETWACRRKNFGENYERPCHEMAENEVATIANILAPPFLRTLQRFVRPPTSPS